MIYPTLKRVVWRGKAELRIFAFWFASKVPGYVGEGLRRLMFRRALKQLGPKVVFQPGFRVTNPELVAIGSNCNFAHGVFITGGGGVTIGDWVGFGPDTKIWSVNHRFDDPDRPWMLQGWDKKPVVIEDDVWLGANVFVMPGVTIGRGAIVSAGAVVGKSVPQYALVCGNPGRVIGWRKKPESADSRADAKASVEPTAPTGEVKEQASQQ
jgi:acetyltransferase-like isoleucine patch superfamily enzyme